MSKFFFASPYQGENTDWSQVYRFQIGSYEGTTNELLPGYDCVSGPATGLLGWDSATDPNVAFDYAGNAYSAVLGFNYNNLQNVLAVSKKPAGGDWAAARGCQAVRRQRKGSRVRQAVDHRGLERALQRGPDLGL